MSDQSAFDSRLTDLYSLWVAEAPTGAMRARLPPQLLRNRGLDMAGGRAAATSAGSCSPLRRLARSCC